METVNFSMKMGKRLSNWLNRRSKELSVSKSALVHLALEQYMQTSEIMKETRYIKDMVESLKKLSEEIERGEVLIVKSGTE